MSNRTNRVFTTEFKERAVLRLEAGEQFSALDAELGVRRKLLYDWCKAYRQLGAAGLNRKRGPKPGGRRSSPAPDGTTPADPLAQAQARVAELERLGARAWNGCGPTMTRWRTNGRARGRFGPIAYELDLT